MLTKYIKGEFNEQYNVTIGVEFYSKAVKVDDQTTVKFQIWDTVKIIVFRQGSRPSEPSCGPSTKESVAYF